jgi:hypothetical protein
MNQYHEHPHLPRWLARRSTIYTTVKELKMAYDDTKELVNRAMKIMQQLEDLQLYQKAEVIFICQQLTAAENHRESILKKKSDA